MKDKSGTSNNLKATFIAVTLFILFGLSQQQSSLRQCTDSEALDNTNEP